MKDGFFSEAHIRDASQCWGSPWRVVARQPREQEVVRNFGGQEVRFFVFPEHAFPERYIRLRVDEMQSLALGIPVRIGQDTLT